MGIKTELDALIKQKLTRREFLQRFGLIVVSVVGLSSFLKYLSRDNFGTPRRQSGYGSGSYGGKNDVISSSEAKNVKP